jgi:bisphosphoglycerate-dependent phosphoglycerate mutase
MFFRKIKAAGQTEECETIKSWKLNERHYGALQGHYKVYGDT